MTFTPPFPADPADLYAVMGVEALHLHLEAIVPQLARSGVEITPAARLGLDELAESVVEHHGRHDPAALARALARSQAALNAGAN